MESEWARETWLRCESSVFRVIYFMCLQCAVLRPQTVRQLLTHAIMFPFMQAVACDCQRP